MENSYKFKITYDKRFVCYITARTEFEAIDKAYYSNKEKHPDIVRMFFNAKKLK